MRALQTISPTLLEIAKLRLQNSFSGKIGSTARHSAAMKARPATRVTIIKPKMPRDDHGKVVPPELVARIRAVSAIVSSPAPA